MTITEPQAAATPGARWFHLTPDRAVIALLAVEVLLWLSERFQWLPLNHHKGYAVLLAVATVGAAMLLMLLWFLVSLIFGLRFQFSIRSLLVLTVVVAVPCSWLAVERKKAEKQREACQEFRKFSGIVAYDYERSDHRTAPGPAWLCRWLGNDFFSDVDSSRLPALLPEKWAGGFPPSYQINRLH